MSPGRGGLDRRGPIQQLASSTTALQERGSVEECAGTDSDSGNLSQIAGKVENQEVQRRHPSKEDEEEPTDGLLSLVITGTPIVRASHRQHRAVADPACVESCQISSGIILGKEVPFLPAALFSSLRIWFNASRDLQVCLARMAWAPHFQCGDE